MQISPNVAKMALSRTDDVDLAKSLAESLGGDLRDVVPQVSFDPAWVRECVKSAKKVKGYGPALELASFALTYCADEELQCEILRSGKKLFYDAVLASPYLTNEVRERMQLELADSRRPDDLMVNLHYRRVPTLREQFEARLIDDSSFFEHKDWFITSLKASTELRDSDYTRLVKRGLELRAPWVINAVFFGSFCLDHVVVGSSGCTSFERAMVVAFDKVYDLRQSQVIKAYKLLNDKNRRDLLDEVVPRMFAGGARHPLNLFFAQEISRLGSCLRPRAGSSVGKNIFTEEAMDFLVADGAYTHLALEHELSDEQFLVALKNSDVKARILINGDWNDTCIDALLGVLETQHDELGLELTFKECEVLVGRCKSSDDPIVSRVYSIADAGGRNSYLCGRWPVEPAVSALEKELARILAKPGFKAPMTVRDLISARVSTEYRRRYIDLVPGAAFAASALNEDLADYVWERLSASTTNQAMAALMFSQQSEQALEKLCATLHRLDEAK